MIPESAEFQPMKLSGFSAWMQWARAVAELALEERGEAPQCEAQVALVELLAAMAEGEQLGADLAGGDAEDAPPFAADPLEMLEEEPGNIPREDLPGVSPA